MPSDPRFDEIASEIQNGVNSAQYDVFGRQDALKHLEQGGIRAAMYYSRIDRAISRQDVLPFVTMLKSIGRVDKLDLIIVSPGGDGTAAETMLGLCRRYCIGHLRVVVPTYAKSAATLIALGADEIVMGESSELGPIDAQVSIMQDNAEQQVSADHFIRAKNEAIKNLTSADQAEAQAAQIQLALLSPAFLQHCQDSMQFGRDFAMKQLKGHMFKAEREAQPALWDDRIDKIVSNLTASSKHLTHGRMITADDIRDDSDLKHLKVTAKGKRRPLLDCLKRPSTENGDRFPDARDRKGPLCKGLSDAWGLGA
ncbi:MAG: hypothetical protein WD278_14500 [Pirellulales bacterium]